MRRRRRSPNVDDPTPSDPVKRQRVSIACNPCRAAKAKCDGDLPCGTCAAQDKTCAYTHITRKRGIQSGYLRSVETSLAWLFEKYPGSEAALHRQLTRSDGVEGMRILAPRSETSRRLHRQWNKSCIPADISNVLSRPRCMSYTSSDHERAKSRSPSISSLVDPTLSELDNPLDSSPDPERPSYELLLDSIQCSQTSSTEAAELPQSESRQAPIPCLPASQTPSVRGLVLPQHWERLVDVFFDYTSCWFPIIERHQVIATASRYSPEGLRADPTESSALDAQLWAVLAVAAFQDAASTEGANSDAFTPNHIYAIACHFSILDDGYTELPRIRAFLLQSLVLLGQQKVVEAWALIGKASRLASSALPLRGAGEEKADGQLLQVLAASFILDTLASLCLGRADMIAATFLNPPCNLSASFPLLDEVRPPVRGDSQGCDIEEAPQPQAVFRQLYTFCRLWILDQGARKGIPAGRIINTQELLQNLNSQFSFCNSLLLDISTSTRPATFLLQAMFLTISLDVAPGPRSALLLNLLDLIETYLQTLGLSSVPPLITTLMSIIDRHGHTAKMDRDGNMRCGAAVNLLRGIWTDKSSRSCPSSAVNLASNGDRLPVNPPLFQILVTMRGPSRSIAIHPGERNRPGTEGRVPSSGESRRDDLDVQARSSPSTRPGPPDWGLTSRAEDEAHGLESSLSTLQQADYSLILDELESVDYLDPLDADLQFMTNLGFVPGCDLGEMFLSDFGT